MNKELWVTTDFFDNLASAGRPFTPADIDRLMSESAAMGAVCHEWVLDTIWGMYDGLWNGYDLLETACKAAHRHGMRFVVVFKPFEGALAAAPCVFPPRLPRPPGVPLVETLGGFVAEARPFVAPHPQWRQARRPQDADPGGRIGAIRLIKHDDGAVGFDLDSMRIAFSAENGNFQPYTGPIQIEERLAYRHRYPYSDKLQRVVELSGLDLPQNTGYLKITCDARGAEAGFAGEIGEMVELVNMAGVVIPSTPACGRIPVEALYKRALVTAATGISRYTTLPEVRRLLEDREQFCEKCGEAYRFDWDGAGEFVFDREGVLAVARGKPAHIIGSLHPAYPEVREHWLEHLRFCLERDVDAVNIRIASHNRPPDPWAYGYFDQDVAESSMPNLAELAARNGAAFDEFLRQAADLLHGGGKQLGVHAEGGFFYPEYLSCVGPVPMNFDWHWQDWLRELVDFVELRGVNKLRPFAVREVVDRIGAVAAAARKPFIYQSVRGGPIHYDAPFPALAGELSWLRDHPLVAGYNLYETSGYSRMNAAGVLEYSPAITRLVREMLEG
ncbi:MAG: hypothetical protein ABR497_00590 [Kiritimatiellia bacterium]